MKKSHLLLSLLLGAALVLSLSLASCEKKKERVIPERYFSAELFSMNPLFEKLSTEENIMPYFMGEFRNGIFDADGNWIADREIERIDPYTQQSSGVRHAAMIEFDRETKTFRTLQLRQKQVYEGQTYYGRVVIESFHRYYVGKTADGSYVFIERCPAYDVEGNRIKYPRFDEEDTRPDNMIYLTRYDANGMYVSCKLLYDIDPRLGVFATDNIYHNAYLGANGVVYLTSNPENSKRKAQDTLLAAVTPDGELLSMVALADVCPAFRSDNLAYAGIITRADGEDCVLFSRVDEAGRRAVVPYAQLLGEEEVQPVYFRQTLGGDLIWFSDTEAYFSTSFGIYHEEIEGEGYDNLLSWLDIDLSGTTTPFGNDLANMYFPSPDKFYLAYVDPYTYESFFITVTRSDTPVETDKQIITLAYDESDYRSGHADALNNFLNLASRFNLSSETHRIQVIPYAGDDVSTANEKLKMDIVSGLMPDMILFGGSVTPDPFVRMEEFVDLYKFMDADDTYTRDAFLPCVLEPFETAKGQLPYLVLNFNLRTSMGLRAQVGDKTVWTLDDFENALNNLGGKQYLIKLSEDSDDPRMDYFKEILPAVVNQYIDYDRKRCDFDGDFKRLLALCRDVPVLVSDANLPPEEYRDGNVLLLDYQLMLADDYIRQKYLLSLGEETSLIGAPRSDGAAMGAAVAWDMALAITKTCADPSGAWDFIRFYLNGGKMQWDNLRDHTQIMYSSGGFIPTWECMEILFDIMRETDYICEFRMVETADGAEIPYLKNFTPFERVTDDPKTPQEYDAYFQRQRMLTENDSVLRFTESDEALFRSLFANCTAVWSRDDAVLDILYEEASAYFAGAKSLDDTIRLMENRVKTRINE